MKVPYLDLEKSYSLISPELTEVFKKVLKSGRVILGSELSSFEIEYSRYNHTKYTVGVANGLDALILSLIALGIKKGDEVIVPSNTYIATLIAVSRIEATPVLIEPDIATYNMNPDLIEAVITKKTKAIIPVHLFGQACEMDKIMKIAKKYNLKIIEDNAQAHGSEFLKKKTGSFGHVNATSFYPGKNLGAVGDGGAITTNNKKYYQLLRMLRNYGESERYKNPILGYNSRLDEIQAAFLRIRLKKIEGITKKKKKIANIYLEKLTGIGDIILPEVHKNAVHVYHIFCVRTQKRNQLKKFLDSQGITTLIHYPVPPHLQKAYEHLKFKKNSFPIAEELAKTSLSLPIFPEMTNNQIEYVINSIKDFYAK